MTTTAYEKVKVHADVFNAIREFLNERERRLFLAETAKEFGYGAGKILSRRTGVSCSTIRRGIKEMDEQIPIEDGRVQRQGAGRKLVEGVHPEMVVMSHYS